MKLVFKKFVYLLNDLTNAILKKENDRRIEKMNRIMALLSIALFLSVIINVVMLFIIN